MSTFDDLLSAVSKLNNPATGVTEAWKSRLQGIEGQLPDVKTKVASLSVLDDAFNSKLQPFIKNTARDTTDAHRYVREMVRKAEESLAVASSPLEITPTSLDFIGIIGGPNPPTQEIHIQNIGSNTLTWHAEVTNGGSWLIVTPTEGELDPDYSASASTESEFGPGNSASVTVAALLLQGLTPQSIPYSGTVSICERDDDGVEVAGSRQVIHVNFTVQQLCSLQPPQSACLTFTAEAGTYPKAQQFTVSTAGDCTDQITVAATNTDPNNKWLQVTPHQQTIPGGGESATFAVAVASASLPPGSYTDQISISAKDEGGTLLTGSPQYVEVSLNIIAAPALLVSPSSGLVFNDTTGKQTQLITIQNTGGTPLSWTATLDKNAPSFVQLSPKSGGPIPGGGSSLINVSVDATGVTDDETFRTSVLITATDQNTPTHAVAGSPAFVPVTINISHSGLFLCVMKQFYPPDPIQEKMS